MTTYAAEDDVSDESVLALRRFLHRIGRDAEQGEVGVVIDGKYFGITEFDRSEGI